MFNHHRINTLMTQYKLKNKKFTKQELCEHIGLSPVGLDSIISGKSNPKINNLEKIADFFKVDMNYFFDQYQSKPIPEHIISEPEAHYGKENPWKICYELQREITELKVEVERCKKFTNAQSAGTKTA